MMTSTRYVFAIIAAATLALVGCSAAPGFTENTPTPTVSDISGTPTAEPSPESTPASVTGPTADSISCDTMLDPLVDQALRSTQLLPFEKPWTQFGFEPTGAAVECPWGYEGQMHSVAYYAWSALAEGEDERLVALAEDNGNITSEDERGIWVTPLGDGPELTPAILITDEWIAFAPTPELISAILWTR